MNKYLNKSNLKFAWWFIFNLLTTLFVVSLIGFFGGTQGEDGLDGRDGSYIRDILTQNMLEKPTGSNRETYADNLIEEGFLPIDSLEDIETYFYDDFAAIENSEQADYLEFRNFVLTADLDFSEATENQVISPFYGEGDYFYFRGIFDGAGYTISGFESDSDQENVGFFPRVDDAIIRNVTFYEAFVSNASYSEEYGNAGVIVGYSEDHLDLINVTVDSSDVQSRGSAGGFVGNTDGTTRFINSHIIDSEIAGTESSGGFIGLAGYGDVLFAMSSSVDSFINGNDLSAFTDLSDIYSEAGGFIGEVDDMGWVYVYRSFNTSKVESDRKEAGGFFGQMDNINRVFIAQSYNAGLVQSFDDNAGGMIGELDLDFSLIIQDSFNIGTIYGYDESGGLIGNFERDNRHPESSIINVYNAGKVLGIDDSYGGIIGDQDESMLLTIQTSFSFTSFSRSNFEFNPFDSQNFPTNGSIIGDVEEVLFDQVYYYVEANNPSYAPTATNKQFDFGTVAIEDEASFHEEDFVLNQAWDFQSIWEFTDAFDFPTLQEVEFLNPGEETELEFGLNVYGGASIDMLETEEGYTPFEFYFYDFYLGDDKDSAEDLTIEFGYLDTYYSDLEADLENLLADIEIFYTQTGYPVPGEVFEFTPVNDNYNYLYVIVTDSDGNKNFDEVAEFEAQLILLEDVIAPTTTDAQVNSNLNANNVNSVFVITSVFVSFTTATDNVSSHANLNYYVLISDTNEAFVDANSAFALFGQSFYKHEGEIQNEITEGIFTGNWAVTGFEFNTEYYVAVVVQDEAGNLFLYTPDTIQIID
jgi:hypothetical protein